MSVSCDTEDATIPFSLTLLQGVISLFCKDNNYFGAKKVLLLLIVLHVHVNKSQNHLFKLFNYCSFM